MKKIILLGVLCIALAHLASAEVLYQNGEVVITGSHLLKDITNDDFLEIDGDECYLKEPVRVTSSGTLRVTDSSCDVVHMYPDVTITVYGIIYFDKVKVTSYDPETGEPIELTRETFDTQRPDIVTRSSAQYFSAKDSEFSYLGYYNPESSHWGVALRYLPNAYISNSDFHHNYFGIYSYDSDSISIKNSRFYDNLEYGINIHDFSDDLYAYNNTVYRNGNHGIILSKFNEGGSLILNKVFDHTQNAFVKGVVQNYGTHGMMLHQQSNNNLLSRNELTNNREGITIAESDGNLIKTNKVFSDLEEGFVIRESSENDLRYNKVIDSDGNSLYSFNSFFGSYADNNWGDEEDIVYVKIEYPSGGVARYYIHAPGADVKLNHLAEPPGFADEIQGNASVDDGEEDKLIEDIGDFEVNKEIDRAGIARGINRNSKEGEREYVERVKEYEEGKRREFEDELEISSGERREFNEEKELLEEEIEKVRGENERERSKEMRIAAEEEKKIREELKGKRKEIIRERTESEKISGDVEEEVREIVNELRENEKELNRGADGDSKDKQENSRMKIRLKNEKIDAEGLSERRTIGESKIKIL